MKLVGLTLARNEQWTIEFCLRTALKWCDEVLVMLDRCTDRTQEIVSDLSRSSEFENRIKFILGPQSEVWDEMNLRQYMLTHARSQMYATHFAIVDADEALTANLFPDVRGFFQRLSPGELLELPMLAARTMDEYHDDNTVWSKAMITLGFRDMIALTWRPGADSYQHHHRAPYGHAGRQTPLNRDKGKGGVIHGQFFNRRRLLAKHALYKMVDHIRWPGRESVQALNSKYGMAPFPSNPAYSPIPAEWWTSDRRLIDLNDVPYQEDEIKKLIEKHGRDAFKGLDLFGY